MAKKTYTTDELTPEVIKSLQEQYGEITKLIVADKTKKYDPHEVPDDEQDIEDGVFCLIRRPTDKEISYAMSKLPAMLESGKVILKACFLGGDERILTDVAMLNSASLQCLEFIQVRQTKLVKL